VSRSVRGRARVERVVCSPLATCTATDATCSAWSSTPSRSAATRSSPSATSATCRAILTGVVSSAPLAPCSAGRASSFCSWTETHDDAEALARAHTPRARPGAGSPYRVPLVRLRAAQAALKESGAAAYTAAGG
jgi:hypothetical protein